MLKTLRRVSMTNVAYVLLLLSFVTLGMFVYALAVVSPLAGIFGVSMVVSMAASVVGFRMGANIWDQPLRREQIDRYLQSYCGVRDGHEQLLQAVSTVGTEPTRLITGLAA
jgi:hypothetical protein